MSSVGWLSKTVWLKSKSLAYACMFCASNLSGQQMAAACHLHMHH